MSKGLIFLWEFKGCFGGGFMIKGHVLRVGVTVFDDDLTQI